MVSRGNIDKYTHTVEKNVSRLLSVAQICRVVNVYEDKKYVDLQPLALTSDGRSRAMLIKVPVSLNLVDYIKLDGIAVVLFMDRNIKHFDGTNKEFEIANDRAHDVNDGIVVGVL